jgi:DNA ligase 1
VETIRPMRACALDDLARLRVPALASPKLDGVRCMVVDGVAMSKNMKPIRNEHVQARLGLKALSGLDGELVVGAANDNHTGGAVLGRTMSGVMSRQGKPEFTFHVFDRWDRPQRPYRWRLGSAEDILDDHRHRPLVLVPQEPVATLEDARALEEQFLAQGYEGACFRHPDAPYKYGKVAPTEGWLWKLKRFVDGEAVVLEVLEGHENTNEATRDEVGRKKRSTAASGMVASGLVGALRVVRPDGQVMTVAAGSMTKEDRRRYFLEPKLIVGKTVTWRAFAYGKKDVERFAQFASVRHPDDVAD